MRIEENVGETKTKQMAHREQDKQCRTENHIMKHPVRRMVSTKQRDGLTLQELVKSKNVCYKSGTFGESI